MLRVNTCIDIALRCVDTERNKRPYIKDIVNELEELEAKIQKMTLSSDHSKAVILGQQV
jgi:interleukin-1 receptor-associated kinase 1